MHAGKGAASAAQATELPVCLAYAAGPDLVRRLMATTCSSSHKLERPALLLAQQRGKGL